MSSTTFTQTTPEAQSLYSPSTDFLLLGGGSILALVAIKAILPIGGDFTGSLTTTLFLANIINHPHFAHSYQIFYRNFGSKILSPDYSALRARYVISGVLVPLLLSAFFYWAITNNNAVTLGIAANAMFFLVGWHYTKQGYGMAMVDAALKRAYFSEPEKKALLLNGHVVWMTSWLLANQALSQRKPVYFGIEYVAIPVSDLMTTISLGALTVSSTILAIKLALRHRSGRPMPWNGLIAYAASLYAWLLVRDPIVLLWVPLFHSLQYLAVVWKYQTRAISLKPLHSANSALRFSLFVAVGVGMGYAGFWALPNWLDDHISYDSALFGDQLFYFVIWIFINIHHYFLDTVMWRKGNPDVARNLFGATPPSPTS